MHYGYLLTVFLSQTSPYNTQIYIGNLSPDVTDAQLRHVPFSISSSQAPLIRSSQEFGAIGPITDVRINEKGFGFVTFASHENAARAILVNNGLQLGQKQIKVSWGKDKNAPQAPAASPYGGYPPAGGYGYPTGGQYGYGGGYPPQQYGGYPQQGYGAYPPQQGGYGGYPPSYGGQQQ